MKKDEGLTNLFIKPIEKPDYTKLDIRGQSRFKGRGSVDHLEVWAMDGENLKNGDTFLLTDNLKNHTWKPTLFEMLKFIMLPEHQGKTGFCYNLRFDGSGIVKELKEEIIKKMRLDPKQQTVKLNFSGGRGSKKNRVFIIQYRGSKGMKVKEGRKTVRLSDLPPFYPGMSLDEASSVFLGEKKIDIEKITGVKMGDITPDLAEKHKDVYIRYCKRDAELTAKLGVLCQKENERRRIFARDYPSPASLGERFVCKESKYIAMTHPAKPSTEHPCLDEMVFKGTYSNPIEYGWLCFGGGWFECCKRGYFPKLYKYDINSAFPAVAKTLINLDSYYDKEWIYHKKNIPDRAVVKYGFIKAKIKIRKDVYLSPIPYRVNVWGSPLIIYPVGEFTGYVTINEFDYINENLGKAEMIDGFFFLSPSKAPEAIYKPIVELYKEKQRLKPLKDKDPIALIGYTLTKLYLNSASYGKFIQKTPYYKEVEPGEFEKRWKTGNMFNPIWATIITSEVRLQIARAIRGKEHTVVMIMTDGILTTELLNLPLGIGLGQWTCEVKPKTVVVRSGVYQSRGKKIELKTKGFKSRFGTLDNPYTDLYKYLEEHPNDSGIIAEYQRPLTLNECMKPTKKEYNKSRINEFVAFRETFNLKDDKRDFDREKVTCKDFLKGTPIMDSRPQKAPSLLEVEGDD